MFLKNKSNPVSKIAEGGRNLVPTVIAQDFHLLGNIVSEGVIDLDGKVDGNVRCHTLNVRKNGVITGEVMADDVFVYGKIKGTIRAKNVYLYASCHIEGIVLHESIAIEDGAFLDGKCKRTDRQGESDAGDGIEDMTSGGGLRMLGNIKLIS